MKKKLLLKKIVPWPASLLVRFLCGTARIRQYPGQLGPAYVEENKPFIFAVWHSRIIFAAWYFSFYPTCAMISRHSDGELAAATFKKLGMEAARGSSTEGGMTALRKLVQMMNQGLIAAITPDGPRGPARRLQEGVISLGQLSQRPIIPISFSSRHAVRLKSWDRFLVPMPFSRSSIVYGEPIMVPRKLDAATKEEYRIRVEAELNRVTDLSDEMVGQPKT